MRAPDDNINPNYINLNLFKFIKDKIYLVIVTLIGHNLIIYIIWVIHVLSKPTFYCITINVTRSKFVIHIFVDILRYFLRNRKLEAIILYHNVFEPETLQWLNWLMQYLRPKPKNKVTLFVSMVTNRVSILWLFVVSLSIKAKIEKAILPRALCCLYYFQQKVYNVTWKVKIPQICF